MTVLEQLLELEIAAADFGFKWENSQQILDQIRSEITEIEVHLKDGEQNKLREEIGDLLHAVFSLCVFNHFDPEKTLTDSVNKFARRFAAVQRLAADKGLQTLNGKSFAELMEFWNRAKILSD